MNSQWNVFPFRRAAVALLASVALLGMGCGGLGASGSISPATFLLPGFGQNDSQKPLPADAMEQPESPQVAAYSADLVQ